MHMRAASELAVRRQLPHFHKAIAQIFYAEFLKIKLTEARCIRNEPAAYFDQLNMAGRMLAASEPVSSSNPGTIALSSDDLPTPD
jgi:hypothetical protein